MKIKSSVVASCLAVGAIGLGLWLGKNQPPVTATNQSSPASITTPKSVTPQVPVAATAVSAPVSAAVSAPNVGSLRERVLDARLPLAERLAAADERAIRLRALMVTNAAQVLAEAVSFAEYAALPEALQARVERPFSRAAEWRVLPVCDDGGAHSEGAPSVIYQMVAEQTYFKAYPVGARSGAGSKNSTALQGVTLGDLSAVRGEALQVLNEADAAAAKSFFGMAVANRDATRDFLTGETIVGAPVTAAAGGKLFQFASAASVTKLNEELAAMEAKPGPKSSGVPLLLAWSTNSASSGGFSLTNAWTSADLQASTWTETVKKVYVIRVDFSDLPGAPMSLLTAQTVFKSMVSNQVVQMSYGKTAINADISPMVVRLPLPTTGYLPEGSGPMHDAAKAAFNALGTGVNLGNYDIVAVAFADIGMTSGGASYAGLASLGSGTTWFQGWATDDSAARVCTHEFGHNYGLSHAKFWETSDGSVVGAGTSNEYGDLFDIMGFGPVPAGHFHPQGKSLLNWLTTAQWSAVTGSGTFRIWRCDDAGTTAANRRAIRVPRTLANDYYWIGYRRAFTNNIYLSNGAYVTWQKPGDSFSYLIDTTPNTAEGRNDGAIAIGRTYSDTAANVHITSVAQGGTGANEWLDVRVNRGPFPGNRAPNVTLNGPTNVSSRTPVTFSVTGSDPDGDTLAFFWDAGTGGVSGNSPSFTANWFTGGSRQVKVTVSDMKGATTTRTLNVTVNDPLDTWTTNTLSPAAPMKTIAYLRGRFVALGDAAAFLSFDGINWQSNLFTDINFKPAAVAEDGGNFITVGQTYDFGASAWVGAAYRSPDGRAWNPIALPPATAELTGVAGGSGNWVAVGVAGEVVRSTDGGTNWSALNVPNVPANLGGLASVAYGNGQFVAVGETNVITSSDGLTWTDRSSNNGLQFYANFADVTFWNGRFYAAGFFFSGSAFSGFLFSPDNGQTWQVMDQPGNSEYFDLFSAVGGDGWVMAYGNLYPSTNDPTILVSANGTVAQKANPPPSFTDLAWGAGRVVGIDGSGGTARSASFYPTNQAPVAVIEGLTNANARTPVYFACAPVDPEGNPVRCIWDFGAGQPLVEGTNVVANWPYGGSFAVKLYATDEKGGLTVSTQNIVINDALSNWFTRTSGTTTTLYDICTGTNASGQALVVAVGADGGTVCRSTNGVDWLVATTGLPNTYLYGIVHDGVNFVAVGQSYFFGSTNAWVGCLWTSPDAINWTCRQTWDTNFAFNDVAAGPNALVAVGDRGTILRSTDHGTNWTQAPSGVTNQLQGVSWGSGTFVAVGGSPLTVLTSSDGGLWTDRSAGAGAANPNSSFAKVQFAQDRFLASGADTKLRYSLNGGLNFTNARTTTEYLPAVASGGGVYLAAGIDQQNAGADIDLISADGLNWNALAATAQPDRRAAVFFQQTFITVGDNGSIRQSAAIPAPPAGWQLYRQQQWPGLPGSSDFAADYDGDGQANGLEYALGSNPRSVSSRASITGDLSSGYLTLNVTRSAILPDVVYQVERSADLVTWTTSSLQTLTNTATQLTVRSQITGATTEFLRVKILLP